MGKLLFLTAVIFASFSIGLAQGSDDWSGFYFGGNGHVSSEHSSVTANSVPINQITNVFVTGRGIVVVPSTTRSLVGSKRETNFGGGGQVGYQWQSGRPKVTFY